MCSSLGIDYRIHKNYNEFMKNLLSKACLQHYDAKNIY